MYRVRAIGQVSSCSSRLAALPVLTWTRTGGPSMAPFSAPFSQWSKKRWCAATVAGA